MKVKLLMSTPEQAIGESAKICYSSKSIDDGGKDITSQLVHGSGHLAVLRFAYATVNITGISVACQNQIVRSKHLDFLVQSKRYVSLKKGDFDFIMPENLTKTQENIMNLHWEASINRYDALIQSGVKKEDARAILPANTSTEMNITGNLQSFYDFFILRLNKHAQEEIRNVAKAIYIILQKEFPQVFTEELYNKLL